MIFLDRISTMCSDVLAKNKNNNMFYEHATDLEPKKTQKTINWICMFWGDVKSMILSVCH